jgi:hypothetical protein
MLGGILGLSAMAAASPNVQFQTVINQGDPIAGDQFENASQVVVAPDGTVGIVGLLENSGNEIVIYSTPQPVDSWDNQVVAVAGQNYPFPNPSGTENFNSFDNLAMTSGLSTGTRLTFDAQDSSANGYVGILQWDAGNPTILNDVAFQGDNKGYSVTPGTLSGGALVELQVNGSGQVLFPATPSTGPGTGLLVRGDESSLTTVFTSTSSLSNTPSGTNTDQMSRLALGADNSGAALLTASGNPNPGVYIIPANGGAPSAIPLGSYTLSTFADPIIGYASGLGVNATLILANGSSSRSQNILLSKNGGTPQPIVAQFTQPTSYESTEGQMTPNGQIALYIPNTTGDTIQYANAASANSNASVVASVYSGSGPVPSTATALDPSGSNLDIEALTSPGSTAGPEINSSGTILFDAEVGTSPGNEKAALMDWMPGDQSPEILLAAGDQVDVDGSMVTIDDFYVNNLSNDYDYYKNGLNDLNEIAIGVDYTGGPNGSGSAVLYAAIPSVPEPSTIALVSVAAFGLFKRRRR